MIVALLAAWVWAARAEPADALDPATRLFWEEATREEAAGRRDQAAALYRIVLSKDPAFLPAALGLGRALEATGSAGEAEALYRSLGDEADAVEALARLVEPRSPAEALALWRRLQTLRLGHPTPWREVARLLAATDPAAALDAWRTHTRLLEGEEPDGAALLAVGTGCLDAGLVAEAEALWRGHLEAFPDGAAAAELRARVDRLEIERAAGALFLGGGERLPDGLRALYAEARADLAAGRVAEAEEAGRALVADAPRSTQAHGLLADALQARGALGDAELHAVFARMLAPDDVDARARLGLLLAEAYGGRRDAEAAEELRAAVLLRPADGLLRYRLGVLEQSIDRWDAATAAFDAFLAGAPEGPEADDARARLEALRRAAPQAPDLPAPAPSRLPPDAEARYRVALVYLSRGRAAEGVAALDEALALAPGSSTLLGKRAQLARQAGESAEAERLLRKSLEAEPEQPAVMLALGDLAVERRDPDAARRWYDQAAALGAADAHLQLARLSAARGEWGTVQARLDAWEAAGGDPVGLHAEGAIALRARADRHIWGVRAGAIGGLVLAGGVPVGVWLRRRSALTLRDLLDGAPESWHEAARLLAGLRHEVLKHNTTVLPDVAEALGRGDRAPWDNLARRAPELDERFAAYLGALEALGRRHGMRVDLRHRDPVLAPMLRAMRRLARLAARPNLPAPAELRALSAVINGDGYAAIGALVREICVLPVTDTLVHAVYARVAREPGFAGAPVPELEVTARAPGLAVRMFRADLEDILANLLRNALAAGAGHLAVVLDREDDPITGQEWVDVQVHDDAPGALTLAMIRGRFIGRGLGLAVDLINKHGGSIRVDTPVEGRKAVCVQLPGVEAAAVEVEWS